MAQLSVGQNRSLTRPSFWGLKACSEPAATATKKKKKTSQCGQLPYFSTEIQQTDILFMPGI